MTTSLKELASGGKLMAFILGAIFGGLMGLAAPYVGGDDEATPEVVAEEVVEEVVE